MELRKLTHMQRDALKEVGNIGAGHAATALSQIIGRKIEMTVPEITIIDKEEMGKTMKNGTKVGVGVYTDVFGSISAHVLIFFSRDNAFSLVDIIMKRQKGETKNLEMMEESALKEIGNILSASYLNAISDFANLFLMPSIPKIIIDSNEEILKFVGFQFAQAFKNVLLIETEFVDNPNRLTANFYLIPDEKSLSIILENLNVPHKEG